MKNLQIVNGNKSFTFYDNANGTILRSFDGFEYGEVRDVIEDVAGNNGALYVTSRFGRRRLSWSGDLVGSDVFTLRRQMLSAMRQQGQLKLLKFTTYDDLELQCEVEIVKILNPYTHKIHTYLIEAIAPDWRFYSQEEYTVEVDAEDTQIVENLGNEVTPPIFRIHGAFEHATIQNLSTGEDIDIDYTLTAGSYIEINTRDNTVKLDDGTPIFSAFSGEFISLLPGENDIAFTVVSGDESTKLDVIYRDAYNGL